MYALTFDSGVMEHVTARVKIEMETDLNTATNCD
jgi:hypothetical protein